MGEIRLIAQLFNCYMVTKQERKTARQVLRKQGIERPDFDKPPPWKSRPGKRIKRSANRGRFWDKREKPLYDRIS